MRVSLIAGVALFIAIVLYAAWPAPARINPDLPQPGMVQSPPQENSTLIIPIEVGFTEIGTVIEKHFPDGEILHTGHKQESPSLKFDYTVQRSGKATSQVTDGALKITLPLRIDAEGRKDICLGIKRKGKCRGIKTHETGEATALVDAHALVAVIVTEDYQVEIGSHVTQKLTNSPHLKMDLFGDAFSIKIDIEDEVEKILAKQEAKVTNALDKMLAKQIDKLDLQEDIRKKWEAIRSPIAIGDAWVSVNPQKVLFKGIHQLSDKRVALGFGFSGPTAVSLTKPETRSPSTLPSLSTAFTSNGFNLAIPLKSAFSDLNKQAQTLLRGRTLRKDGYWLEILDIALSGATLTNTAEEERATLVAAVTFKAGKGDEAGANTLAEGILHLTFMPAINQATRTLDIIDVAVTSDTSSLIETAGVNWINSKFTPQIMAQLHYNYGQQIDIWQPKLNTALQKGILYKGFTISGELTEVNLGGFYISGDSMEVYLKAQGSIVATVERASF